MQTIATAQAEYYRRPADERFPSFAALTQAAQHDRDHSKEFHYNLRDLKAHPSADGVTISSPNTPAGSQGTALTPWAFGQLARTVGAPTAYLRTLEPRLMAECLNYGLQHEAPGERAHILARKPNGQPAIIRACTSESYARVWDADIYARMARNFGDGVTSPTGSGQWMTPPAWPGSQPSGNYRGDRDSFVIRVDGGSIVSDPSARSDGQMYRALMVRNSEVGAASITIDLVLFRYVCGNHMLWGAILDRRFRRRHVGSGLDYKTVRELADLAYRYTQRAASDDENLIKTLIAHELAHTKEAVIDEARKIGLTKEQAEAAYAACERTESASPRSFWGFAQGLTRVSQESGHQDARLALDRIAAQVIARGAKVAA